MLDDYQMECSNVKIVVTNMMVRMALEDFAVKNAD